MTSHADGDVADARPGIQLFVESFEDGRALTLEEKEAQREHQADPPIGLGYFHGLLDGHAADDPEEG